ncbi:MAG: dihydroorotase [Endomicrobium sp.]|jgi:dihydroorotase|nr:dihydroorotase [Endomicrobium sp.]
MQIYIKNIRVIDPIQNKDNIENIFIKNDYIVSRFTMNNNVQVIDGTDKIAIPGLIDIHSHLRTPGEETKETIHSGTKSAAAGGITTVLCMPNTNPVIDNVQTVKFILTKVKNEGIINVLPVGCATQGSAGNVVAEIGHLKDAGVIAISDDGLPITNTRVMRCVLEYTKMFNIPLITHSEDLELSKYGVMNEGLNSTILGLKGIPNQAEDIMVSRDIMLAELTGAHLHIAHVSTAGSVNLIRQAKKKGIYITAETCPHYFTLTDDAVKCFNTNAKVNPPLRTKADIDAIKHGLADGTIDCICTDHAPHTIDDKNKEFEIAPFGIIGFETVLNLVLEELVDKGILSLSQAIAKMTCNPAKIFHLTKRGSLTVGNKADITIINPKLLYTFNKRDIHSKSKNSPFIGRKFKGKVVMTIVSGNIVHNI